VQVSPVQCSGKNAERQRHDQNHDCVGWHCRTPVSSPTPSWGKLRWRF
jgi:hypothetical protein